MACTKAYRNGVVELFSLSLDTVTTTLILLLP